MLLRATTERRARSKAAVRTRRDVRPADDLGADRVELLDLLRWSGAVQRIECDETLSIWLGDHDAEQYLRALSDSRLDDKTVFGPPRSGVPV